MEHFSEPRQVEYEAVPVESGQIGALDSLPKVNIDAINRDLQRLAYVKQHTLSDAKNDAQTHFEAGGPDCDDLEQYLEDDPDDCLKVLENDFTINRKAVFHDIDRLRRWRESVDQEKDLDQEKYEPSEGPLPEVDNVPVSEDNLEELLNKLPDVTAMGAVESAATAKLAFLEKTIGLATYILPSQNAEKTDSI